MFLGVYSVSTHPTKRVVITRLFQQKHALLVIHILG